MSVQSGQQVLIRLSAWIAGAAFFLLVTTVGATASEPTPDEQIQPRLEQLDTRFQEVLDGYLRQVDSDLSAQSASQQWQRIIASDLPVLQKLASIRVALPALQKKLHQADLAPLQRFLYTHNDTATVQRLADEVRRRNASRPLATHYFLLAQYYYERQNWGGVTAALASANLTALPLEDRQYASLLQGFALQQQRQHRKAYEYYKKIPSQSPYYAHAKLNEGTAYLRQGWWTEAHMQFKSAIESLSSESDLRNRLFVVLGYSQLHYEFYRDARKTLRNVSLSSQYTNKALMGLGLSAAYQKDFSGALNAFKILVEKTPKDVNVDEAMLLLAKVHEELNDTAGAVSAYGQAIEYYEDKRAQLAEYQAKLRGKNPSHNALNFRDFEQASEEIYGRQQFIPDYFLRNYDLLLAMREGSPPSARLGKELNSLTTAYRNQLQQLIGDNIEIRRAMLDSYISQAKLGMAQLYDRP